MSFINISYRDQSNKKPGHFNSQRAWVPSVRKSAHRLSNVELVKAIETAPTKSKAKLQRVLEGRIGYTVPVVTVDEATEA
jgi:hypothetical protein